MVHGDGTYSENVNVVLCFAVGAVRFTDYFCNNRYLMGVKFVL